VGKNLEGLYLALSIVTFVGAQVLIEVLGPPTPKPATLNGS
jgi:hypothetical protein